MLLSEQVCLFGQHQITRARFGFIRFTGFISVKQAYLNYQEELKGQTWETLNSEAKGQWESLLSRIQALARAVPAVPAGSTGRFHVGGFVVAQNESHGTDGKLSRQFCRWVWFVVVVVVVVVVGRKQEEPPNVVVTRCNSGTSRGQG